MKQPTPQIFQSVDFLNDFLDILPIPVVGIDLNYNVVYRNKSAKTGAKETAEPSVPHKCYMISHGFNQPCKTADHICPLQKVIETGKPCIEKHTHFDALGNKVIVELTAMPIFDEHKNLQLVLEFANEITQQETIEDAFQAVFQSTATDIGTGFFNSLVSNLASVLNVRYAIIGELIEENKVQTLAVWTGEGYAENFAYDLSKTPCNEVVHKSFCFYPRDVQGTFPDDHMLVDMGVESYMGTPLKNSSGTTIGIFAVLDINPLNEADLAKKLLTIFAVRAGAEIERQQAERKEITLIEQLQESEEYFRKENIRLKATLSERYKFGNLIGKSEPMQEVYENILNAAATDAGVIIYGESGTGKELVAKEIHENSDRKKGELVYINCGAIPETLIESEFFGHKKGAFSGATSDKVGFLELARGGTIFLDEIGEIPLKMQVKLLRVIEGNTYTAVGDAKARKPDVRIIAATNSNLKEMVHNGNMRQDFLYRIHIIPIHIPPLRERKDDIRLLIDHFLSQYDKDTIPSFTAKIRKALHDYNWPGNVRELQNTIHRFVTLKKLDFLGLDVANQQHNGSHEGIVVESFDKPLSLILEEVEKETLLRVCTKHKWHQGNIAQSLQINRRTLYRKLKHFGIDKK